MSDFKLEGFPSNDDIEIGGEEKDLRSIPQIPDGAIRIPLNLPGDGGILSQLLKGLEGLADPSSASLTMQPGSTPGDIGSFFEKLEQLAAAMARDAMAPMPEKSLANAKNLMYDKVLKDAGKRFSESFGFIECVDKENLIEDFRSTFGKKDKYSLDEMFKTLGNIPLNIISMDKKEGEIVDFVGDIIPITWNHKFILTAAHPLLEEGDEENYSPIFISFTKTYDQNKKEIWSAFIPPVPKCINTDNEDPEFFSETEFSDLFTQDGAPIFFNPSLAMLSCELSTFVKGKAITTLQEIGEVKNQRPAKVESGRFLSIGTVKTNNSQAAKMLIADSNATNPEEVELCIEFPNEMSIDELNFFSDLIRPINLLKNPFFSQADVKPGNGCFIIQIDLDDDAFDDGFKFLV